MDRLGDLNKWLSTTASDLLEASVEIARRFRQRYYRGPQILLAAMEKGMLDVLLVRQDIDPEEVISWASLIAEKSAAKWSSQMDPVLDAVLERNLLTIGRNLERQLDEFDILEAIFCNRVGMMAGEFRECPVSTDDICIELTKKRQEQRRQERASTDLKIARTSSAPQSFDENLSRFGRNLTESVSEIPNYYYSNRLEEIRRIAGILGRLTRPNPMIVGKPGVGKTSLVEGFAAWLKTNEAPSWLKELEVYVVACSSLIAGAGYRGQLEERVQGLIDAALVRNNVVLFLDEIDLLAESSDGSGGLLVMFNQYLAKGSFRLIAATTTKQFDSRIRDHAAFVRRFEIVRVEEPSHDQVMTMMKSQLPAFRDHYGFDVEETALQAIISNCERHMASRCFPDKAISTLDSAFQKVRPWNSGESSATNHVTVETVLQVISEETTIPVARLGEMEKAKLQGLQAYLDGRIFDQQRATTTISRAIQSLRLGLNDPARASSSFLLVGPPGTGKTELAKAISEYLIGSESALVRFNMSEFQTPESYQRLVGPPPGYVGYDEGGELTNRLIENPYSVILLDEIEKGSNRVFDVFLQILSDGHLTDNHGRVVNCRNSLFVMTSNALANVEELSESSIRERLLQYSDPHKTSAGPTFRREFVDRLEIIPFDQLNTETLKKIALREVHRIVDQVNEGQILKCRIDVGDETMDWIVRKIDVGATGARSVQRLVEKYVSRTISQDFSSGKIKEDSTYQLKTVGNENLELIQIK